MTYVMGHLPFFHAMPPKEKIQAAARRGSGLL
jgi:hypothetical protein